MAYSAPPARTAISDTYPNPSNATARTGFGALWDYVTGLLGSTGNPSAALTALQIGPVISYRNLLVNNNFAINQRVYVSGTATGGASQVTLDRWRVVTSGQNITFAAAAPDRVVTCPAGGLEQVIEAGWIVGGVYTLSWTGTATATVNGTAITNGGQTSSLTANTAVTVKFASGTVSLAQFELGSVATPFERRPPCLELSLCKRDYAKSYAIGTTPGTGTAAGRYWMAGNVGSSITGFAMLPVSMRAAPTVSLWDNNGAAGKTVTVSSSGVATANVTASAANITDEGFEISAATTDVVMSGQWAAATGF